MSSPTKLRQMAKELGWPPELEKAADQLQKLERENAALRAEVKVTRQNYEEYKSENAALREALDNADELERYSGSDGHRQWGKCSAWLHPDDAVVIISAKALDAARKEAQP